MPGAFVYTRKRRSLSGARAIALCLLTHVLSRVDDVTSISMDDVALGPTYGGDDARHAVALHGVSTRRRALHRAEGSLGTSTRPRSEHDLPLGWMGRRGIGNKHSTEIRA